MWEREATRSLKRHPPVSRRQGYGPVAPGALASGADGGHAESRRAGIPLVRPDTVNLLLVEKPTFPARRDGRGDRVGAFGRFCIFANPLLSLLAHNPKDYLPPIRKCQKIPRREYDDHSAAVGASGVGADASLIGY